MTKALKNWILAAKKISRWWRILHADLSAHQVDKTVRDLQQVHDFRQEEVSFLCQTLLG